MPFSMPRHDRPAALDRLIGTAVRATAFIAKELREVLRQPRLLVALIVGPFLILFLFGSSFKGQVVEQPTVLVVPPGSGFSADPADYADAFRFPFTLQSVVASLTQAEKIRNSGKATVIIAVPEDASQRVQAGQYANVHIIYQELEPARARLIQYYARTQINELNRRLLVDVVEGAKGTSPATSQPPLTGYAADMQGETAQLAQSIRDRDEPGARTTLEGMRRRALTEQYAFRTRQQLIGGVHVYFGVPDNPTSDNDRRTRVVDQSLLNIQTIIQNVDATLPATIARGSLDPLTVASLLVNSTNAEEAARALELPPSSVLVSPFQAQLENRAPALPNFVSYYAPAVLALLLQHICITLTALSLVRERIRRATELFQATSISTPEIIFGKSVSYALIAATTGGVLVTLMLTALDVPMAGSYAALVAVIALLVLASLGVGIVLSAVARSEMQAVQYAMLALLLSVFFGNFFLPLDTLYPWAQAIAHALPITYAVDAFQEIMLSGTLATRTDLLALGAFVVGTFTIGTLLFRRQIHRA